MNKFSSAIRLFGFLILSCFLVPLAFSAIDLPVYNPNFYVTDAKVETSVATEDALYIGGDFKLVGPYTGSGVPVLQGGDTGLSVYPNYPKINGIVRASISDGAGGWFVAGQFEDIDGIPYNRLARITGSGELDAWAPDVNNADINAMVLSPDGKTLYVAGSLKSTLNTFLARIDVNTANVEVAPFNDNTSINTITLSSNGKRLFIGGNFETIAGFGRSYIAEFDVEQGNITDFDPQANGEVYALALSSDDAILYVGGHFTEIGSETRKYIAAIKPDDGTVINSFVPDADDTVHALALSSDDATLFVGGAFTDIAGSVRNRLAALDTTTGDVTDFEQNLGGDLGSYVSTLALSSDDKTLYVGGDFKFVWGGNGVGTRIGLAVFDTSAQEGVGALLDSPGISANAEPLTISLLSDDSAAFVGGYFSGLVCEQHRGIAAVDIITGSVLPGWQTSIEGNDASVRKLLLSPDGNTLYIGGYFHTIKVGENSEPRSNIGAIDLITGEITDFDPSANEYGAVRDMVFSLDGETLFLAGDFYEFGNPAVESPNIAAVKVSDSSLVAEFDTVVNGIVYSLALSSDGEVLYFGGDFTEVNQDTRNYIAAVETSDGGLVDEFDPDAENTVYALALSSDGILYVGGSFRNMSGNTDKKYIAAINVINNTFYDDFEPLANDPVYSLALSPNEDRIFIGGNFTIMGGLNNYLALLDAKDGLDLLWNSKVSFLDGRYLPSFSFTFAPDGSTLYLGGSFRGIGGFDNRNYSARFDLAPSFVVLGSDGKPLASSAEPTAESGTYFAMTFQEGAMTNEFTIVNHSAKQLTLNYGFEEEDTPFSAPDMPRSVDPNSSATFHVIFAPADDNIYGDQMTLTGVGVQAPFILTLGGSTRKAEQTINFPEIPGKTVTSTVELEATASSGLPVIFEVLDGPGVIDGTLLSFTGTGVVTIQASQPGDEFWAAAEPVTVFVLVFEVVIVNNTVGDYDGDGRSDFVVVNPDTGDWYLVA
ncbi:MAG: WD40 repeat domain-containing protein, partial [Lentisphaerae bacterium]|nr:WD40 repeat domain-containing protein [Lentisphaerota bacterium]